MQSVPGQVIEKLPRAKIKVLVEGSEPPRFLMIKSKYLFVGDKVRWDGLHHGMLAYVCPAAALFDLMR